MYYVLKGSGAFIIEGQETEVETGDLIVIPRGVTYQDKGKMTLLCFNSPRWRREGAK